MDTLSKLCGPSSQFVCCAGKKILSEEPWSPFKAALHCCIAENKEEFSDDLLDEAKEEYEDSFKATVPKAVSLTRTMILANEQRLYWFRRMAVELSCLADEHFYYQLMMWCYESGVFIHPSLQARRRYSVFRDHQFFVAEKVSRFTPLIAIPRSLLLGFGKIFCSKADQDDEDQNALVDREKEAEFNRLNAGEAEASDICSFFFSSINMMVSDVVTAKGSPLTDKRYAFAQMLSKVRTLHNAPYLGDEVVLDHSSAEGTGLADVLLQMIRNYIKAGPLVNKVPTDDLRWILSVCLAHSTPMSLGKNSASIGIIPLVHLFPHGGRDTNSYVIAPPAHETGNSVETYIMKHCGLDFSHQTGEKGKDSWVYLVPERDLEAGEEVRVQAMAPACDADIEAYHMWVLSCSTAPEDFLLSSEVEEKRRWIMGEMIRNC